MAQLKRCGTYYGAFRAAVAQPAASGGAPPLPVAATRQEKAGRGGALLLLEQQVQRGREGHSGTGSENTPDDTLMIPGI